MLLSSEGEIRLANARAARMAGASPEELVGRQLAELLAGERDALAAYLRTASRSNTLVPGALTLKGAAGPPVPCRAECGLLEPRAGEAPALLLMRLVEKAAAVNQFVSLNLRIEELANEVTRRQRAEAALRERSELLRITLASIGDAVIATDTDGRVTFMNPVAEGLTGWPQEEAAGRALDEVFVIVNESTRRAVESPVGKVLREGAVVGLANHTVLIARDGTQRPIDDSGAPIRDARGGMLGVVLVFRDISERRAFERERAETDRRKDEFLAMLAHELRNPLAVLANGLHVIERVQTASAAAERDAVLLQTGEAMQRQVRQLARMVDDLLDVSRITMGKVTLERSLVRLDAVLRNAMETWRPALERREIRLELALSPEPLVLDADAGRLAQVFGNLLSNAAKFSEPRGLVRIAAAPEGGQAVVRVTDRGTGIPADMLRAVFELFVQADTSLARDRGGLGVGLTVARRITELHGGSIEARSEGPGRGSEFIVRLPLAAGGAPDRSSTRDEDAPAAQARSTILVVDDNADAAASLAALLRLCGHEVHVAHDGESALRQGESLRPQVILLDIGLPGVDGYEVARRLRAQPGTRQALIIAVTGYGGEADRGRALRSGFDHHLTKPVGIDRLESLMAAGR
jgi:PAS domain S-box-containing protein